MPSLRPPVESFRQAGWLPSSQKAFDRWMSLLQKRISPIKGRKIPALLPSVQEFKDFIESDSTVYTEFVRMFDGVDESPRNYNELVNMLNDIFRKAPYYGDLGPPVYMVMARIMNTQGGFSAFTKEKLNIHFKKLFETWAVYLASPASRYVLVEDEIDETYSGWFSPEAKAGLMAQYSEDRTFEEVFICDPSAPYHGYLSYDDFFNRRFRSPEIDRPITGNIDDLRFISAACECVVYDVQEDVQRIDELFIKDEAYSLLHLLNNDPYVDQFIGGTVIQGFLNTTGYHRWHAPVNGTIRKIVDVPGTYFAQAPGTIDVPITFDSEMTDLPPYLQSLTYFANTAARQLIFIQADNADIGLLCFIAIGMTEISTCKATVYDGQHVNRGDELGMFHFGGSSQVLLFNSEAAKKIQIGGKFKQPGNAVKINEAIAVIQSDGMNVDFEAGIGDQQVKIGFGTGKIF